MLSLGVHLSKILALSLSSVTKDIHISDNFRENSKNKNICVFRGDRKLKDHHRRRLLPLQMTAIKEGTLFVLKHDSMVYQNAAICVGVKHKQFNNLLECIVFIHKFEMVVKKFF